MEVDDDVLARRAAEDVVPGAPVEVVVVGASEDHIGARAAHREVVAPKTEDDVGPAVRAKLIVPRPALEPVAARSSMEHIRTGATERPDARPLRPQDVGRPATEHLDRARAQLRPHDRAVGSVAEVDEHRVDRSRVARHRVSARGGAACTRRDVRSEVGEPQPHAPARHADVVRGAPGLGEDGLSMNHVDGGRKPRLRAHPRRRHGQRSDETRAHGHDRPPRSICAGRLTAAE